jgi:hypothetical protein
METIRRRIIELSRILQRMHELNETTDAILKSSVYAEWDELLALHILKLKMDAEFKVLTASYQAGSAKHK